MTKADESQQERYKGGVVPMEDIEKHAPEVRTAQPQITDAQAELVHVILHDGCNPTEAAERLQEQGLGVQYATKTACYRIQTTVGLLTLGWDATQAMATMRELLTSKSQYVRLEAARDLMDRAGFRQDAVRTPSTAVQINFNVD